MCGGDGNIPQEYFLCKNPLCTSGRDGFLFRGSQESFGFLVGFADCHGSN
jgi:hypothetical protein